MGNSSPLAAFVVVVGRSSGVVAAAELVAGWQLTLRKQQLLRSAVRDSNWDWRRRWPTAVVADCAVVVADDGTGILAIDWNSGKMMRHHSLLVAGFQLAMTKADYGDFAFAAADDVANGFCCHGTMEKT